MNEVLGVIGTMLSLGTPLVIASAGETVSERAGVLNIGLEGVMLFAAYAAFWVSWKTGNPYLALGAATLVGAIALLATAPLVIHLGADQVVVGTGLNLLALGITGTLFVQAFGKTGRLVQVETVPTFAGDLGINVVMLVAVVLVVVAWWALFRTDWGRAVRAAGERPEAARAAGWSVFRLRLQAMAIAGLLGGLAGGYLSVAQTNSFAENMTAGRGFVVIAAVTFGRWHPFGAAGAALLIALSYGLQYLIKAYALPLPYQLFDALPYLLALAVLVGAGRAKSGPAALAIPYKEDR
ncbi:MAG: ABC transporter permease [Armatimonadetes bacterium]|nr:MAG: ABC transporter permease [Armatimonadota bacterium]